ncbi:MAG TPA: nucleotidyltransferase family protein [Phycisphaerae bacterium]|nr:nucleotidyltransferase family protein [Phycisphaerae bacterium]
MNNPGITPDAAKIAGYCRKWNIKELSIFGSILRDDFGPDSDVDVLITFGPGGGMTFDNLPDMLDELSAIFGGRKVDLVEKRFLLNPYRRREILTTQKTVYAA